MRGDIVVVDSMSAFTHIGHFLKACEFEVVIVVMPTGMYEVIHGLSPDVGLKYSVQLARHQGTAQDSNDHAPNASP